MKMKILVLSLLITPVPVLAFGAEGPQASEGQQKERLICRRTAQRSSETRMQPRRVCMTRLQWRQHDDISTDDLEETMAVRGREAPSTTYTGGMGQGPR